MSALGGGRRCRALQQSAAYRGGCSAAEGTKRLSWSFSNGPDNASSVPPEDVAELAESTGTIIYILSTRQAQDDPASAAAFERVSKASGGKAYFAKDWRQEKKAFASIREDLAHLYTLSYLSAAEP